MVRVLEAGAPYAGPFLLSDPPADASRAPCFIDFFRHRRVTAGGERRPS